VVSFCDIVCARAIEDFLVETGAIAVKVRFALTGRAGVGLPTLGLRGLFAELIASVMALAPVRSANRAIALSERWSERLKNGYLCMPCEKSAPVHGSKG
jgi:hypothetical protein